MSVSESTTPRVTAQDLRFVDGKAIVLPAWFKGETGWSNMKLPDVYVSDSVQLYPVGTKYIDGDRVFHYGYCNDNSSVGGRAMGGMMNVAVAKAVTNDAVVEPVGETEIKIEDTTSTVDQWAGGYYMPRIHPYSCHRVLSNTVSDGEHCVLTLERGLLTATAASEDGFLNQNMYSKLSCQLPNAGKDDASVMGVNLVTAVASEWLWIQTWGPCYISGGDELLGVAAGDREAKFHQDGTLMCPATVSQTQRAGYAINETDGTSTWFVFLQLAC